MLRSLIIPRSTRSALVCAAVLIIMALTLAVGSAVLASDAYGAQSTRCSEDDPCWAWPTMGNRHRGVITRWGNIVNVGPCTYSRMYRAHRLDSRNVKLRGDHWAIVNGCIGSVQNF